MERRTGAEPNLNRASEIGGKLAEKYLARPDAIKDINTSSRGQLQLVLQHMMFTLTVEDMVDVGLRMRQKKGNLVNDFTIMGDIIGGMHVFEGTDFSDRNEYEFMVGVVEGIREKLQAIQTNS